ncbi:outer membrane beta-barrel protein [Phaeocystidibacter marisrubri]|uniref:PorT family protein n=1 Tax=Phaeocystidibacter marisrubri TaxID=1577780 RepID=A0A6L3ZFF9_9FLAO|nr:outer membrane beta-barrel protein [Phaeocystidibacter marisrubri]KAB2816366.1 PorT family protein [Phaeocystidibacter marisrubri]GGH68688.1 hypothetical protein GCM10011318_08940 [Phaeocystidibacter marisrubri]
MTEKELEKLFRKKFEGRTFEFNPAAWEGAEKLIVQGERRKRRRVIASWSAAASVALIGGLMSWNAMTTPESPANNAVAWPSMEANADVETIASQSESTPSRNVGGEPADASSPQVESRSGGDESSASTTSLASHASSIRGRSDQSSSETSFARAEMSDNMSFESQELLVVDAKSYTYRADELALAGLTESDESMMYEIADVSAVNEFDERSEEEVINRPRHSVKPWTVAVEGGVNMTSMTGGARGMTPSYYGGGLVNYSLNDTWGVQSGLTYARRSSFGDSRASSTVDYGFGSTRIDVTVQSKWVDYLELPVSATYAFGDHQLEAGIYAAYKLMGMSKVTRTTEATNARSTTDTYLAQDTDDDNSDFDMGLQMGYAYRVSDRWKITANGVVGLTDGFAFENSGNNQHLQFRLGGRYMLW